MTDYDTYTITRDGQPLGLISPAIRVVDVVELAAARSLQAVQRAGVPGSFVTRDRRTSLGVRIQFAVLEDDYTLRTEILGRVAAWAKSGSYLTIDDRPGQRLACICSALPATQSKRKWTGLCEMTFTAYHAPFWEDMHEVVSKVSGASSYVLTFTPPGTYAETPLRGRFTAEGAVDTLSIMVNGNATITFAGLGLTAGDQLHIGDSQGLMNAYILQSDGFTDALLKRTAQSADDLMLTTQMANEITIIADGAVSAMLRTRGRYE